VDHRDIESERPDAARLEQAVAQVRQFGEEITGRARAKDGSNPANAATVTLADGRKVFAGSSGTPSGTP
jgi:hypothetical protein